MNFNKDPRFGFSYLKNDRFNGLDDYRTAIELSIHQWEMFCDMPDKINNQFDIFGDIDEQNSFYKESGLKGILGRIFEVIVLGIYDGKLGIKGEVGSNEYYSLVAEPDIVHEARMWVREVKAFYQANGIKLKDEQIRKYCAIQLGKYFGVGSSKKEPVIKFELFKHGLKNIQSDFKDKPLEELVEASCENIRAMISLPFSVVYSIHGAHNILYEGESLTSRAEDLNGLYYPLTKFKAWGFDLLLAYPEKTLKRIGLNPNDYSIERRRFPTGASFNGYEIIPFPVLIIDDKNHEKWLKKFKKNFDKNNRSFEGPLSKQGILELVDNANKSQKREEEDPIPF